MSPTISYLIFTHNEGQLYLEPLLKHLFKYIESDDEVIIIDDNSDEESTLYILEKYKNMFSLYHNSLNGDFATHKNFGISKCTKEYIIQIDADEIPSISFMTSIKEILINNNDVELFYIPRTNVVNGITDKDIAEWRWQIMEYKGNKLVNWPDYQGRVWLNKPEIKWEGKVHERLIGHTKHTYLPAFDEEKNIVLDYALLHVKDIYRQRKQNQFYTTL